MWLRERAVSRVLTQMIKVKCANDAIAHCTAYDVSNTDYAMAKGCDFAARLKSERHEGMEKIVLSEDTYLT